MSPPTLDMRARLGRWLAREELDRSLAAVEASTHDLDASARALQASTRELERSRRLLELAEFELRGRKIRLTGAPTWTATATPDVVMACDAGVIVGAVVHELREDLDGWRAYCRLEGSGAGSIQWAQELHTLERAQAETERMIGELAAAAAARAAARGAR